MDRIIQHFNKGEIIIQEGHLGDRTYRIVSGEVLICKKNSQGKLIPITKLGVDDIFGEMYLFDTKGNRTATVMATSSRVQLEVLFQQEVQTELHQAPKELQQMVSSYSQRLQTTTHNFTALFKEKMIVEQTDGSIMVVERPT